MANGTIWISFTNPPLRGAAPPVGGYDYAARYHEVMDDLPELGAVYFLPTQAGSEGDGQDLDLVDPMRWNRMLMGARPSRVGVYTGLGEAKNTAGLVPGSAGLKMAVRAYRGSACVIFDKASYPEYIARTIPIVREFALAGLRVGFEANADTPQLRAFLQEFPGTLVVAESWLWTPRYLRTRLDAAAVRALGGVPVAMVNRRVARKGTVGWTEVAEADWPEMKVTLAEAFAEQGMRVLLRDTDIDAEVVRGLVAGLAGVA